MNRGLPALVLLTACRTLVGVDERPIADAAAEEDGAAKDAAEPADPRFAAWPFEETPTCNVAAADGQLHQDASGLVFQRDVPAAVSSLAEAEAACAALADGKVSGFDDWRLPTRIELVAVAHYQLTVGPRVCSAPSKPLDPLPSVYLCSRSTHEDRTYLLSTIDASIVLATVDATTRCHPRCIHAPRTAPRARYERRTDGVYDRVTRITWQSETTIAASQADAYDRCRKRGTGSDWRLPSTKELSSLVDETEASPMIDATFFPATTPGLHWAVDVHVDLDKFWTVDFATGTVQGKPGYKTSASVRCVKSGG